MKDFFEFTKRTEEASKKALTLAEKKFSEIDEITEYNQRKVLAAFINNRVTRRISTPLPATATTIRAEKSSTSSSPRFSARRTA